MESKRPFTVATGVDDNYVLPLLVMIYSAKVNSTKKFHLTFGFDSNELSISNQEMLSEVLKLLEVSFDFVPITLSKGMDAYAHLSPTSYLRLLLADDISGLMLWLDSDLLCLPGWDSIYLEHSNLPNGKVLSAVRDAYISNLGSNYAGDSNNESLKKVGVDYFNSGVSLIDCDKWRALNYPQEWPKLLREIDIRGFKMGDQDIMNFLCHRQVHYLPWEYNALAVVKNHNSKLRPFISHFAGSTKPWFFTFADPRILRSSLRPSDIYKYLRYQSRLIKTVKHENLRLGLVLIEERKRIRISLKQSRIFGLVKRV